MCDYLIRQNHFADTGDDYLRHIYMTKWMAVDLIDRVSRMGIGRIEHYQRIDDCLIIVSTDLGHFLIDVNGGRISII